MPRRSDWPEQLAAAVRECQGRRFAWGSHDCLTWAADVVVRLGGPDILAGVRGTYADEDGAMDIVHSYGGDLTEMAAAVAEAHGLQEVPPILAQRGDLVVLRTFQGPTAGICVGAAAMAVGESGPVAVPMSIALRAWAI